MTRRPPRHAEPRPRHTRLVAGLVALGVLLGASGAAAGISPAALSTPATAVDSSAVTVAARDQDPDLDSAPMPDLEVTVSQTRDLQAQGIQISWTGGTKSEVPTSQTGGKNFLQIMQCWGDDPDHPGQPDRRTCQYGALLTPGSLRDSNVTKDSIAAEDQQFTDPGSGGFFDPPYTSVPFLSATGETVASVVDNEHVQVDVNTNKFFTSQTTNEISWAGSSSEGTGLAKFEVQTAAQSPGLGCGTPVEAADGSVSGTSCWLVVLPRGGNDPGQQNITTSGLFYDTWKHRVAVKLDFRPIGVRCAIGAAEQQLAGSELVSDAIASWQPALCGAEGGSAYTNIIGSEADAALAANGTAPAPLALTSRALSTDDVPDKLSYAPVALTALSIAFAIDAEPDAIRSDVPQEVADRARQPFGEMKLTPRLLAKLLTNSYLDSLPTGADRSHLGFVSSGSPGRNARNLTADPDFIELNGGDWQYQSIAAASLADVLVPQGRSDAAWAIWQYIQADADAAAFLAGTPDPWGMVVNPYSSTNAAINPNGVAFSIPRADFPKADPAEQPQDSTGVGAVNVVTWRPYTNDFNTSGYDVLRGDGQILGAWDPISVPPKYGKTARALPGLQRVIGVTDAAAAAKYQVFSAALLNPAGEYVAPTTDSMQAAAAAMTTAGEQTQVYGFDPASATAKGATTAYPLTLPVYAAVNPAMKDEAKRSAYAAFIEYAAGAGQESGTELGQLPAGYAPMPEGWRAQARDAAGVIRAGGTATPATSGNPVSGASSASSPPVSTTGQSASQSPPVLAAPTTTSNTAPSASGDVAGALTGAKTPNDPDIGVMSAIVPITIIGGLLIAVLVPLLVRTLTRRRPTGP